MAIRVELQLRAILTVMHRYIDTSIQSSIQTRIKRQWQHGSMPM